MVNPIPESELLINAEWKALPPEPHTWSGGRFYGYNRWEDPDRGEKMIQSDFDTL